MRWRSLMRRSAVRLRESGRGTISTTARGPKWGATCGRLYCASATSAAAHSAARHARARYKIGCRRSVLMQVNDKAPEFTLQDENGQPVRLSDFRGKNV